jgi:hypothetical protein
VTRKLVLVLLLEVSACEAPPKPRAEAQTAPLHGAAPMAVKDSHADHDCSQAHPSEPAPPPATATALSEAARATLTTLRISAHQGSVIVRKGEEGWTISGPVACTVPPERIEQALHNLSGLVAEQSDEQPEHFDLQLVVLNDQQRVLHFDIAPRSQDTDLVQLNDLSRFRIRGLDRELWAPDPTAWCP